MSLKLIIVCISFSLFACNHNSKYLTNYYKKNELTHLKLADSLSLFSKLNKNTETRLGKSLDGGGFIVISFTPQSSSVPVLIKYDINTLQKIEIKPENTGQIEVPRTIIELFKGTVYTSIVADSSEVFFGYKENIDGNTKVGIVVDIKPGRKKDKYIKKIGGRAYIVNGVIL